MFDFSAQKDGVMVPYSDDGSGKHNLNKIGKKYIFSINDLMPDDAGLYQVDVEDANCFSTDFKSKNASSPTFLYDQFSNCNTVYHLIILEECL